MIYVPADTKYNKCYLVQGEGIIRAYEEVPRNNATINYREYYIHSDYMFKDSTQQFNQYTTLPTCLPKEVITNEMYYRVDFDKILVMLAILTIFGLYFPIKIFMKLFRKGK